MAGEFLIDGAGQILRAVASRAESEIALACGAEGELNKLQDKLGILQLVLADAEKHQVKEQSVRHWLEKLKKVAYDAQDVMDDFSYEASRQENEIHETNPLMKQLMDLVLNFCSSSNPLVFRWKMGHMIQDINIEFDKIKEEMKDHKFIQGNVPLGPYNPGDDDHENDDDDRETYSSSSVDESSIVGREAEKSELVALLTNPAVASEGEEERLSVLPILGMGGLGKTTLTKLLYNDEHVKNYFKDLRMWVYVSQDFNVKKLLKDVIAQSTDESSTNSTEDSNLEMLEGKVQRKLGGKRFLLVLDNVWNEDVQEWDNLKEALLCGAKGSKIIVTTRKYEVASLVGTLPTYQLHRLSDDEAWSLFKQRAFRSAARSEERQDLVEVGKRIVKRCGGVPLALKIIGSQLKSKGENLDAWQLIENIEIWDLPEISGIFKVLKVSYLLLPSHLRQCFSYCSIFRKGESIEKETLVQLWMSEGFLDVQPTTSAASSTNKENKVLEEDFGRQYADSLMNRCFFQAEKKNKWGEVISFKMHDLLHDLAQSVVSPVDRSSVLVDSIKKGDIIGFRRLQVAFTHEGVSSATQVLGVGGDKLRVLILSSSHERLASRNVSPLMNLKRLRVLILKDIFIEELPDSIANLKQLRYLELSYSQIRVLPGSFTALYNLQTLKVSRLSQLTELPSDITGKLINLRHLEIGGLYSALNKMPKELSQLRFLQTLPRFKVSKEEGYRISELEPLLHLRDELQIDHLESVENREAAKSANLISKQKIRALNFTWSTRFLKGKACNDDDVLEGLQPHRNLRGLKINNFMGVNFPTWLNSDKNMLPNLVEVELQRLPRCDYLPAFGSFPVLRRLLIREMESVRLIGSEFYGVPRPSFPSLKSLTLSGFLNLKEWAEAPISTLSSSSSLSPLSSFPLLEELTIGGCVRLTTMPTLFPMLRKLNISGVSSTIVMMLGTSSKLTALTSLAISIVFDLTELPPRLLSNNKLLQRLEIVDCWRLQTFPTEELQCLTALEELKIGGFSLSLDSFAFLSVPDEEKGDQFLSGLKTLHLCNSKTASLPKQIEHFTTVETLEISDFPNIVALPDWLGNLPSLRRLAFLNCKKLMQLPSIEAMQRLTALKELSMIGCDQLVPRSRNGGDEWQKISNIPWVFR